MLGVVSNNLVELVRRHHAVQAPTVVELLSAAADAQGAVTDDAVRDVAARTGIPEATVHGVATFYDDLLVPRKARHVRVCTGTACFAATGETHVDAITNAFAGSDEVSTAETVCLGFCHSGPAFRDGDTVDAGPGALDRVLNDRSEAAPEPAARSLLADPVLTRPGDWSGLRRALADLTPDQLVDEVTAADLRGRGGAAFSTGAKWRFARDANGGAGQKFIVVNGDEGDPGSYIDKHLMERSPDLLLEGIALAGYAVGADHGFVLVRSEYPRSKPALEDAVARAHAGGMLGTDILGSGFSFDVTVVMGAGSYVVGEETALLACLQGLRGTVSARPPFPAQKGLFGLPTVVNNVETLCGVPFIAARGAQAFQALSPDSPTAGSKLVCFNERFNDPGVVEVPFGMSTRALCEDVAGGLRDGHQIKALQIGGPLGGIMPAALLDTPFDLHTLPPVGCMVGHGSILAFDETTDMRDVARHLFAFGAHESCGKCFPCRIGLHRAHEEFSEPGRPAIDRGRLDALLEALEVGSLCAHGGGMPAPIRSLMTHFPDELGLTA
jgi:NADH:ubiquinone oxidoreductase subunit F (NADH-binding)/NADH:ubiquinone oxidoreductase subunit E